MKCCVCAIWPMQHPGMDLLQGSQAQARPVAQSSWCSRKAEPLDKGRTSYQTLASLSQNTHNQVTVLQGRWSHAKGDVDRLADQIDTPVGCLHLHCDVRIAHHEICQHHSHISIHQRYGACHPDYTPGFGC